MINISQSILKKNTELLIAKTTEYLKPAEVITKLRSNIHNKKILDINNPQSIKTFAGEILRLYPQFKECGFGNIYGNYYGAERRKNNIINLFHLTKENPNLKMSDLYYRFVDSNNQTIKIISKKREYDPRIRPWYKGAVQKKGAYWTDPYVFITDQKEVGITVAYPLYDGGKLNGVMSADLLIRELSNFFKNITIGKSGFAFLVNNNYEIIAYPDVNKVVMKEGAKLRLSHIKDLNYPWLSQAIKSYKEEKKKIIFVKDNLKNEEKIVSLQSFPKSFEKQWKIVIAVPENDFTGELKSTNQITLLISLTILFLSVIIISTVSKRISNPISILTDETDRITHFQLEGSVSVTSIIKEVEMISNAISNLKTGMRAFKRYVPATLVRQLIQTGEEARLGGKKMELSILFSDIQGFTTISEQLPPEELMTHLSEYLDELTQIMLNNQGTVDKYIGDAIMAFWGAPIKNDRHAFFACQTAINCQKKLTELNDKWKKKGLPELYTRIGIHTGETIVGNMGSSERMNYTVIGDSVNLASRLEGVNKRYKTKIIISESTYQFVRKDFIVRPIDYVIVKGKEQPIKIYELLDSITTDDENLKTMSQSFTKAFEHYSNQEWDEAITILNVLNRTYHQDSLIRSLLDKCVQLKESPPSDRDYLVNKLLQK